MAGRTGLYVHVPFCRQLCPYCDFAVAVRKDPPHEAYADALIAELRARRDEFETVRTIYFGGGTPAMWDLDALARFLEAVHAVAVVDPAEVTIEANPHDIDGAHLSRWSELGIDRISLGVQSFDDDVLRALGRDHDAATATRAVEQVVASGRFRASLDLIYAGPRYGAGIATRDAAHAAALGVEHVSAYELTVEPTTVFGRRARAGTLGLAEEHHREDWGFELVDALGERGYERYEVSSFGRARRDEGNEKTAGARGLHNSAYWLGIDYVGLGVGAHSLRTQPGGTARRRANVRSLRDYLAGASAAVEAISAEDHLLERLFLGARTTIGVPWHDLRQHFSTITSACWADVDRVAEEMVELGWLDDGAALRATDVGLDLADTIAQRFAENVAWR